MSSSMLGRSSGCPTPNSPPVSRRARPRRRLPLGHRRRPRPWTVRPTRQPRPRMGRPTRRHQPPMHRPIRRRQSRRPIHQPIRIRQSRRPTRRHQSRRPIRRPVHRRRPTRRRRQRLVECDGLVFCQSPPAQRPSAWCRRYRISRWRWGRCRLGCDGLLCISQSGAVLLPFAPRSLGQSEISCFPPLLALRPCPCRKDGALPCGLSGYPGLLERNIWA